MREAAEALDKVMMCNGISEQFRIVEFAEQFNGVALAGDGFAMFKWQVKEQTAVLVQTTIQVLCNCCPGNRQCEMIGCKRACRAAKHVARKLIEYNGACHGLHGRCNGRCEVKTSGELLKGCKKAVRYDCVEPLVCAEPQQRVDVFEPERLNAFGPRHVRTRICQVVTAPMVLAKYHAINGWPQYKASRYYCGAMPSTMKLRDVEFFIRNSVSFFPLSEAYQALAASALSKAKMA